MKYLSVLLFSILAGVTLAVPVEVEVEGEAEATHLVPIETLFPHYLVPLAETSPNVPLGNR